MDRIIINTMKTITPCASGSVVAPSPARQRRSRYHPRSSAVILGSLLLCLAFVCFLAFAWSAAGLLLTGDRSRGWLSLAFLAGFGLARLLAFLNNRHLACTLCHGTLLHEKRCRKHPDATRIPGLSYRAATVLKTLCTGTFSCMYCGTPFRLKK
jgi:hypothetical protein